MKCFTKWLSAALAIALLAGSAAAADQVAGGKVKSINAEKKTFVLTDSANKDFTFKLGDNLIVNRAGKESKSDLKAGDAVNLCYDKGVLTWTAHYILVQEGTSKNWELLHGVVKSYDADKKELAFTDSVKKSSTFAMGDASVRINMIDSKIGDIKIGDQALLLLDTVEAKSTLRSVMVERAK